MYIHCIVHMLIDQGFHKCLVQQSPIISKHYWWLQMNILWLIQAFNWFNLTFCLQFLACQTFLLNNVFTEEWHICTYHITFWKGVHLNWKYMTSVDTTCNTKLYIHNFLLEWKGQDFFHTDPEINQYLLLLIINRVK
jgi:hypothetical protein